MQHSSIVGGSSASRVINCPGSVALVNKMPPKPSSAHADEGTLCHNVMDMILDTNSDPETYLGLKYKDIEMTRELLDNKIYPALKLFDEVDPDRQMEYMTESRVDFGSLIPGVFGSTDVLGKLPRKAKVIDWKFGSGVIVNAENNYQLLFYADAAMRTAEPQWVFEDIDDIELVIIQPPEIRRWTTTVERVKEFEQELLAAVRESADPEATLAQGSWCRWCNAKSICPIMTGEVDRAMAVTVADLDANKIVNYLETADTIEAWVKDLRALAFQILEAGHQLPGYKLVPKRAIRQWVDDAQVIAWANSKGLTEEQCLDTKLKSPAAMEKIVGKKELPAELVVAISSGNTLAPESDPRPAAVTIGHTLKKALSKLN